jgi:hypothetical protein
MRTIEKKLTEEYLKLTKDFGEKTIDILFSGFNGYIEIRNTSKFEDIHMNILNMYYNK